MSHRVAIVDDHRLLAEVLRATLSDQGIRASVVDVAAPEVVLDDLLLRAPDAVLLDLDLGEFGDAVDLVGPLTEAGIRVLVMSGTPDIARIKRALDHGAYAYCPKASGFESLSAKLAEAIIATAPLDEELRRHLASELALRESERRAAWAPFERLTDREQTALRELSRGLSVRDIARAWVVSEATVRTHVRGILTKLDVPSQLAAVAAAIDADWLAKAS